MTQHRSFGLNTPNAPAENGKAVDHGCVAVCANKRIRIGDFVAVLIGIGPNGLRQILKVHLMADACARWYNAEVVECALAPFQKLVTFHVAFIFAVYVHLERTRLTEFIDHN